MTRKIVLIRHGKAEKSSSKKDDFDRKLTKKGKKELIQNAPAIGLMLGKKQPRVIWSSPLVRARQTTEILSKLLNPLDITYHDFIAQGNFGKLVEELAKLDEDTNVLIVGHEPTMSGWGEDISGESLPFKTGGAGGFSLTNLNPLEGELEWFLQPSAQKRMQVPKDIQLETIRGILLSGVERMEENRTAFLENPNDPETVHQFRVSIRKLRSLLAFFEPLTTTKKYEKNIKQLKELTHLLETIRENDVLTENCRQIVEENPELQKDTQPVFHLLQEDRAQELSGLTSEASQENIRRLLKKIKKRLKGAYWKKKLPEDFPVTDFIESRINTQYKQLKTEAQQTDLSDFSASHTLRIHSKELRYVLKELKPILEDTHKNIRKEAEGWQNTLGELRDSDKNTHKLQEMHKHHSSADLQRGLGKLLDVKERQHEKMMNKWHNRRLV